MTTPRAALEQLATSLGVKEPSRWGDAELGFITLFRSGVIDTPEAASKSELERERRG